MSEETILEILCTYAVADSVKVYKYPYRRYKGKLSAKEHNLHELIFYAKKRKLWCMKFLNEEELKKVIEKKKLSSYSDEILNQLNEVIKQNLNLILKSYKNKEKLSKSNSEKDSIPFLDAYPDYNLSQLPLTNTIRYLLNENERLKKVYDITNKDWKKQQRKIKKYEEFISKIAEHEMLPSDVFRAEARELLKKHKTTSWQMGSP